MYALIFMLRVNLWVTVNFGSTRDQEPSFGSFSETEHIESSHEGSLCGLDGVVLVVRRRSGTGEVVDF